MEVGGIRIEGEEPHASKVLAMEDASYLQHEEVEMEWGEAPSGRILTEFAVDSRGMLWFFGGMISGCQECMCRWPVPMQCAGLYLPSDEPIDRVAS